MLDECWNRYYITMYFPKNSGYKRSFDHKMSQLRESGIIAKLESTEMDKVATASIDDDQEVELGQDRLGIVTLQVPFILWTIFIGVSGLAFLSEFICKHYF